MVHSITGLIASSQVHSFLCSFWSLSFFSACCHVYIQIPFPAFGPRKSSDCPLGSGGCGECAVSLPQATCLPLVVIFTLPYMYQVSGQEALQDSLLSSALPEERSTVDLCFCTPKFIWQFVLVSIMFALRSLLLLCSALYGTSLTIDCVFLFIMGHVFLLHISSNF